MEHPSQEQPNNVPSTQDKIPHGGERPDFELGPLNTGDVPRLVKELDARETVPDALVGRTAIEDTADRLAQPANPTTEREAQPKGRFGVLPRIGAAVTGLVIVTGAWLGISKAMSGDSDANQPPASEPVATAPANPTGEASPNNPETVDTLYSSFEIKDTTPPEQLGPKFADLIGKWAMFGTADPNFENKLYASIANGEVATAGEYAAKLAKEESVKIADEIFVPGWENDDQIKNAVALLEQNQTATVEMFSKTFNSGQSEDVEPFTYSTTIETSSIISKNEDLSEVTSETVLIEHVNTDQNRATQLNPNIGNINGHKATITATFVKVNGTYKISKLDIKG